MLVRRPKKPRVVSSFIQRNSEISYKRIRKILIKRKLKLPPTSFQIIERIEPIREISGMVCRKSREISCRPSKKMEINKDYIREETTLEKSVEEGSSLLDYLYEFKKKKSQGFASLQIREPHIIVLVEKEDTKEILKDILRRIIEEYEGEFRGFVEKTIDKEDFTEVYFTSKYVEEEDINEILEEALKERIHDIQSELKILNKVFIVNIEKLDLINRIDFTSLIDRLNELKGQGIGFLVFRVKEVISEDFVKNIIFGRIPRKLSSKSIPLHMIFTKVITPEEKIRVLSRLLGLYPISEEELDIMYQESLGNLYEYLRKIRREEEKGIVSLLNDIVNRNEGEESDLHYSLKCLIVYCLLKRLLGKEEIKFKDIISNLERIEEAIKTEYAINTLVADVYFVPQKEVWEVETLFGEGRRGGIPLKKIDETIKKYLEENGKLKSTINKINIVMDSITYHLHAREIGKKKKIWEKRLGKDKIKFFIPNWKKKEFIEII